MNLKPAKDPTQVATRAWVAIDTDRQAEPGDPYSVNGHPMVGLPETVTLWDEGTQCMQQVTTYNRIFYARKRDVEEAIAKVTAKAI